MDDKTYIDFRLDILCKELSKAHVDFSRSDVVSVESVSLEMEKLFDSWKENRMHIDIDRLIKTVTQKQTT